MMVDQASCCKELLARERRYETRHIRTEGTWASGTGRPR